MEKATTHQELTNKLNNLIARIAQCEKRRSDGLRLMAELAEYAQHAATCPFPRIPNPPPGNERCDCGLFKLLKKVSDL
jgi:hypothetical protein